MPFGSCWSVGIKAIRSNFRGARRKYGLFYMLCFLFASLTLYYIWMQRSHGVFPIEIFPQSFKSFSPQRIPIVVFSSYRHRYLRESVAALQKSFASGDIDSQTTCIFVLHLTAVTKSEDVEQSLNFIQGIDFCKLSIWKYDQPDTKPSASLYKQIWWSSMERLFETELEYKRDVFFLEEDTIVSPDFMRVLWYSLRVKNNFGPDMHAVALGGYIGGNTVNPHPDTFVVRTTEFFQAMAYAFNSSFWEFLRPHKKVIVDEMRTDFSEAIALFMGSYWVQRKLHIVVPTLGRMWHIGKVGLGSLGDYSEIRNISDRPAWEKSNRLIDLKQASVNHGIRDFLGFLCHPRQRLFFYTSRDVICPNSFCNYPLENWQDIHCIEQDYVKDKCIGTKFVKQKQCDPRNIFHKITQLYEYLFVLQERWHNLTW